MTTLRDKNLNRNQNNPPMNLQKLLSQSQPQLDQPEKYTKLDKTHMSQEMVTLSQQQQSLLSTKTQQRSIQSQNTPILQGMQMHTLKNVKLLTLPLISMLQFPLSCRSLTISRVPYGNKSRTLLAQETILFRKSLKFWWPSLKTSAAWATTSSMNISENSKIKAMRSRPKVTKPSLMKFFHQLTFSAIRSWNNSELKSLTRTKTARSITPGTSLCIKLTC